MPPKFDPNTPENASLISYFSNLGLSNNVAIDLTRIPKSGAALKSLLAENNLEDQRFDEKQAAALVKLSAVGNKLTRGQRSYVVARIVKGDLKSSDQVAGTYSFGFGVIAPSHFWLIEKPLSSSWKVTAISRP
jgi:glutaminyl-tRNA synthetase